MSSLRPSRSIPPVRCTLSEDELTRAENLVEAGIRLLQDTATDICYNFTDQKIRSITFTAMHNGARLEVESGGMLHISEEGAGIQRLDLTFNPAILEGMTADFHDKKEALQRMKGMRRILRRARQQDLTRLRAAEAKMAKVMTGLAAFAGACGHTNPRIDIVAAAPNSSGSFEIQTIPPIITEPLDAWATALLPTLIDVRSNGSSEFPYLLIARAKGSRQSAISPLEIIRNITILPESVQP